jgi:hypothetical protein
LCVDGIEDRHSNLLAESGFSAEPRRLTTLMIRVGAPNVLRNVRIADGN